MTLVLPTALQPPTIPLQPRRPYGGLESAPSLQNVYDVTYGRPGGTCWVWTAESLRVLHRLAEQAPAVFLDRLTLAYWDAFALRRPFLRYGGPAVLALSVGKVHVPRVLQLLPPAEHEIPDYLTTCKAGLGEPTWTVELPGLVELAPEVIQITLAAAERSEHRAAIMRNGMLRLRCYMHDAIHATHRVYLLGDRPESL